ncbi:type II secretion system minor pseudopilin GspJ [Metapseudomonas furukawaii]|uniref:type II secretion system minor pseudopilin GspJ n=1 Tax=Metapseudomonas furukawaii TaxID=1149133 RepID=UPI00227B4AED|nr:type II secretion system minor pseudopilin GspJ [Pseudomonas furukawaii]WAG78446.1 type II secretion system minor pseudopilin GspJ [Pseudomonas furukawaii]
MRPRGFTLLEVLIAMALFSLLGLACYQLLERVTHGEQRIQQHERQWRRLQRAMDLLQRDLWQAMAHPLPDDPSRRQALIGRADRVRLVRGGWANPLLETRSEVLAVEHRWEQGQWWREFRPLEGGVLRRQRLLDGVTLRRLQYVDAAGRLQDAWPAAGEPLSLPRALVLELDAPGFPELRRVILLPGADTEPTRDD